MKRRQKLPPSRTGHKPATPALRNLWRENTQVGGPVSVNLSQLVGMKNQPGIQSGGYSENLTYSAPAAFLHILTQLRSV